MARSNNGTNSVWREEAEPLRPYSIGQACKLLRDVAVLRRDPVQVVTKELISEVADELRYVDEDLQSSIHVAGIAEIPETSGAGRLLYRPAPALELIVSACARVLLPLDILASKGLTVVG